jgi:HemY protein
MLIFYRHIQKEEAFNHQGLLSWIKLKHNKNIQLDLTEQFELLKNAHEMIPTNPIIASHYALELHNRQHKQKGLRVLQKSYKYAPHRLMAETWLTITNSSKSLDVYKKIEKLTASQPNHEESYWLLTKKALDADLWGQARHHIQPLLYDSPTKSVYQLMIEIEEKEHPDQPSKADFWKIKLNETQLEWKWMCKTCHHVEPTWDAFCSSCGDFGVIEWKKTSLITQAPLKNNSLISQQRII